MNSKPFAFRIARPIESTGETPLEFTYDPQSQTSVWSGSGAAVAFFHCTYVAHGIANCSAYGNYCTGSGRGTLACDT